MAHLNFLSKEGISKIFSTSELLVKGRYLQNFFHFLQIVSGNSYGVWVYLLLLEGRIVPSCQLQQM